MNRPFRRYLLVAAASTLAILAATTLFSVIVDPYGITSLVEHDGLNRKKPHQTEQARIAKPTHAALRNFDVFVIGTSQVEQGFNPADPRLKGLRVYNLGLSELRMHEAAGLTEFLSNNSKGKTLLISLDFLRYNSPLNGNPFLPAPADLGWRWIAQRLVQTFLSFKSLKDAWNTIQWNRRSKPDVLQHDRLGWLNIASGPDTGTQESRFDSVDRATFESTDYVRYTASRASHLREHGFDHTELARIVRLATERGLNAVFFVAPRHARQHEILRLTGLLPLFAQWQAEIACVVGPRFSVWDFSGYNDITVDDSKWSDTVHFRSEVGTAILDRSLGIGLAEFRGMTFGRKVDPLTSADWKPGPENRDKARAFSEHVLKFYKGEPAPVSLPPARTGACRHQ